MLVRIPSYTGDLLVNGVFKNFTDSICREFKLQYPPLTQDDALLLYFII